MSSYERSIDDYVRSVEAVFERGNYRETLNLLAEALERYPESAALGLWQAIATDASGDTETAIELVKPLTQGGDRETRKQASYLLKIWQAPRLARPETWMTDVPSVTTTGDRATVVRTGVAARASDSTARDSESTANSPVPETAAPSKTLLLSGWWIAMGAIVGILVGTILVNR
ncbi:MAG: tetratricopeptide repeat protein [Cyanobacteria bacterium J06639_1]